MNVTLMEHDSGDLNKYKGAVHDAVLSAVGIVILNPSNLDRAMQTISDAVLGALGAGDDVIATTSRLIRADEMKYMGNMGDSKPNEHGISHDVLTAHRGQGGSFKVYFDIITQ